jgi:hypothetical protein
VILLLLLKLSLLVFASPRDRNVHMFFYFDIVMHNNKIIMLPKIAEKKNQKQKIQLKLSTIFKQEIIHTPQAFGSLYDANGEKYCAVSALSRFFGYDIATASTTQTDKNANPAELIPHAILEMIDNFTAYGNSKRDLKCSCSKPDYYYHYSLIALLIHLNDYHKMTFAHIGSWLEGKEM